MEHDWRKERLKLKKRQAQEKRRVRQRSEQVAHTPSRFNGDRLLDLLLHENVPQLLQLPQPQLQQNSVLQQFVQVQNHVPQPHQQESILQQQLKFHPEIFQSPPLPTPVTSSMLPPFLPRPTNRLEPHPELLEAAKDLLGCLDDFLSPSRFARANNTTDFNRIPLSERFDPLWAHIEQRYKNSASTQLPLPSDFLRVQQQGLDVELCRAETGQNAEQ